MGSRSALPVLLFSIALAAGGFFWFSNRETSAGREVAETSAQPEVGSAAGAVSMTPTQRMDLDAETATPARSVVSTPQLAGREQEAATRSAGRAGVSGVVVNAMGQPVAGARVYPARGDFGFNVIAGVAPKQVATTDEAGRFLLDQLMAGSMRLSVRAPGYAPFESHDLSVPSDAQIDLDPFVVQLGAILIGRILDPDGRGIPGAGLVRIDEGGSQLMVFGVKREPTAVADESGSFRLDELAVGPWKILVQTEGHPDRTFEGETDRAGEVGGLEFRLKFGAMIRGSVSGVPEGERAGLVVRGRRVDRDGGFNLELGRRTREAEVSDSGTFELAGLDPDATYDITALTPVSPQQGGSIFFRSRSRSETVRAAAGDAGVRLLFQPEAAIAFQVFDAKSKAPLTEYTVHHGTDWLTEQRGENGRIITERPEGRGRLGDLRMRTSEDRLQFEIRSAGYATFRNDRIVLAPGEELDLGAIYLERVPVLRLTVLDQRTGDPVVGARVRLKKQPERMDGRFERRFEIDVDAGGDHDAHGASGFELGGNEPSGRTDEDGVVELSSLEGETCVVSVSKKGYAPFELESLFMPFGEIIERTVRLTRGGSVLVQALDVTGQPLAGMRISHRTPSELAAGSITMSSSARRDITNSEGQVLMENLAPGLHAFKLAEDDPSGFFLAGSAIMEISGLDETADDGWRKIEVAEALQAAVTLIAPERGVLAGRVSEGGLPLAGARLSLEEKKDGPSFGFSMPGMGGGNNARSDGSGSYQFADVPEGTYILTVNHPTRHMSEEFEVDVDAGNSEFNIDLAVCVIEGRITGAEDQPLPGVKVTCEPKPEDGAPRVRQRMVMIMETDGGDTVVSSGSDLGADQVYTDADGRYSLRGVLADVPLLIKAEGDDVQPGQSDPVTISAGEVKRGVNLTLDVAGSVEIEALIDGAPARFCMVRANYDGDEEGVKPKFAFIQSGVTTLRGMRPGKWLVTVNREGPGASGDGGQERLIEVIAGETGTETFHLDS